MLLLVVAWFAYSFIENQKFNEYIECNQSNAKVNETSNPNYNFINGVSLCNMAITHQPNQFAGWVW